MANSDINNGANYLASLNLDGNQVTRLRRAARLMGISEQEALQLVSRAERKINRRAKSNTPIDAIVDQFLKKASGVAEINKTIPANTDDYQTISNREVETGEFGNQDELQNFGGRDEQGNIGDISQQLKEMEQAQGRRDPNVLKRHFFESGKQGLQTEEMYIPDGMPVPERFVDEAKNRDFGVFQYGEKLTDDQGVFAPARQVQRIELERLQRGVDKYGADVFPGAADAIGRIEDELFGNRAAEQSLTRELIMQGVNGLPAEEIRRRADLQLRNEFYQPDGGTGAEGKPYRRQSNVTSMPIDAYKVREAAILSDLSRIRQDPEQVEANNWRAQAEARIIGQDFQIDGRGTRADEALAKIGQIEGIGHAKTGQDFRVSNKPPIDSAYPDTVPIGLAKGYVDPYPRSSGPLQRQQQWLVDQVPSFMSPNSLAGTYPSVAIGEQLNAAQAAIQRINFGTKKNPIHMQLDDGAIRNLDDLQEAVDAAVSLGQQQGIKFYNYNHETGVNDYVAKPGISSVLQKGRMNDAQMTNVARALFTIEAARRSPVNQVSKTFFNNGMGQPSRPVEFGGTHESLGGGMVGLAGLNGETVEGQKIKPLIKRLTGKLDRDGNVLPKHEQLTGSLLNDARMNLIAGVKGQAVPREHFARKPLMGPGPVRLLSEDQTYDRMGEVNGQYANDIMRRWEQAQGINSDGFGARVERQRNMDPGPPAAAVDTGTDPWTQPVGTGDGISQEVEKRRVVSTPNSISTSGSSQRPRPSVYSRGSGITPDGPTYRPPNRKQVRAEADYQRTRRYGRNAAIAGGAVAGLAGLDALIGEERDNREQEMYR